jgi:hypothetical protein
MITKLTKKTLGLVATSRPAQEFRRLALEWAMASEPVKDVNDIAGQRRHLRMMNAALLFAAHVENVVPKPKSKRVPKVAYPNPDLQTLAVMASWRPKRFCVANAVCKATKAEMAPLNGQWQCQNCGATEVRP